MDKLPVKPYELPVKPADLLFDSYLGGKSPLELLCLAVIIQKESPAEAGPDLSPVTTKGQVHATK